MTLSTRHIVSALLAGALLIGIIIGGIWFQPETSLGSAPPGAPAWVASSTAPTVPVNVATTIIATSSCSARIISTGQTTAMLTFADDFTPTGSFGVWQAASTTVAYDSGLYGCGEVKAWTNATGVITVTDVR